MTKERSNVLEFIKNHSWEIKENALYKKYIFSSFSLAIKFINQVAEVSKANSHHPKLINSYNSFSSKQLCIPVFKPTSSLSLSNIVFIGS